MAQYFSLHPDNPQVRLLRQTVELLRSGAVIALPTDSCYALCCHVDDKLAVERIRRIRQVDEKHHLTLLCRDLSEIANYAKIDNQQYRWLKHATPGPYTIILQATREVPRRLSHPSRKTIGIRIPENRIAQALLAELNAPLISTTLMLPDFDRPLTDPAEIRDCLEHQIDAVLAGEHCTMLPTTVIDLTGDSPQLIRLGRGEPSVFGL